MPHQWTLREGRQRQYICKSFGMSLHQAIIRGGEFSSLFLVLHVSPLGRHVHTLFLLSIASMGAQ